MITDKIKNKKTGVTYNIHKSPTKVINTLCSKAFYTSPFMELHPLNFDLISSYLLQLRVKKIGILTDELPMRRLLKNYIHVHYKYVFIYYKLSSVYKRN